MIRLLILLLGALTSRRLASAEAAWAGPGVSRRAGPELRYEGPRLGDGSRPTEVRPPWSAQDGGEPGAGRAGARRADRAARMARGDAGAGSPGGPSGVPQCWWWA